MFTARIRGTVARTVGALALAGTAMLVTAGSLATEDPVVLTGSSFVDTTGTLTSQAPVIAQHLDDNNAASDADLAVVVINSFDGADPETWTNDSAIASGLGDDVMLLAIAVNDGVYWYSIADEFPRSDDQINEAIQRALDPALSSGDIAGGITAFSDQLREQGEFDWGQAAGVAGGVAAVAAIGGGAWAITAGVRRKKRKDRERARTLEEQQSLGQLEQEAKVLLVRLDDAVKDSEQELQFAQAQFGTESTAAFADAVTRAKQGASEAFGLQQKLEDAFEEPPAERQQMAQRIIEISNGAGEELARQGDAFDNLRQIEGRIPDELQRLQTEAERLRARFAQGEQILDELDNTYSGSTIEPVINNVRHAQKQLAFVDEALGRIQSEQQAGRTSHAAVGVRAAQASIAQADALLAGVEQAQHDLAATQSAFDALVKDTETDIATAKGAKLETQDLTPLIQLAEQQLQAANERPFDLVDLHSRLQQSNEALDRATGTARAAQERDRRAASRVTADLAAARARVDQADQFIATRRAWVGERARTLLHHAQQQLARAQSLESSDPTQSSTVAREASSLADRAYQAALDDTNHRGGSGYGRGEGYYRDRGSDMMTGGLLGYILGDMLDDDDDYRGGGGHSSSGGGWGDIFGGGGDGGRSGGGGGFFGGSFRSGGGSGFGGFGGGGSFGGGGGGFSGGGSRGGR